MQLSSRVSGIILYDILQYEARTVLCILYAYVYWSTHLYVHHDIYFSFAISLSDYRYHPEILR